MYQYGANWTGAGETKHAIWIPNVTYEYFELEDHEEYDLRISFTKESWHGRMKASRGVGTSLCCIGSTEEKITSSFIDDRLVEKIR